jgi:hypothetical protein
LVATLVAPAALAEILGQSVAIGCDWCRTA